MKKQLCLGAVIVGLCSGIIAQAPSRTDGGATTTFTSRSEMVLVPVAVREKSGPVASGIKKENFRLVVDGKTVPIASFEEVKSGAGPALLPPEPGIYTNRIANEDQPQRLTVLLLDYLNTPFFTQQEERQEMAKFVQHELKPDEPVALLALTRQGLRMLQTFTTNSGDLALAIGATKQGISRSEANGLRWVGPMPQDDPDKFILRDRIRLTLTELEQLGNALAGVPGRKVVVWTTAGFPYVPYDKHSPIHEDTGFLDDYERVSHSLNQANVALYPIDAKGLVNTLFEGRFSAANGHASLALLQPRYDIIREDQDTLKYFAAQTGGVACVNLNQYESCIEAAQQEAVDYYLLSFRVTPAMRAKGWNKIDVKVDGKYEVRARQGFTLEKPRTLSSKDEMTLMGKALRSPLESTGLKISFQWLGFQPLPAATTPIPAKSPETKNPPVALAKYRVELPPRAVEIDTANQNRLELTIMATCRDGKGEYVCEMAKSVNAPLNDAELQETDRSGTDLDYTIALPAGHLLVRFAVRDRMTGRIGTIEAPIDVPGL